MEENIFRCGSCAWWWQGHDKKPDDVIERGYCTAEPPKPFPMPKASKLAMGNQDYQVVPAMFRPITHRDEPPCMYYQPNAETRISLDKSMKEEKEHCDGMCDGCGCQDGKV